MINSTPDLLTLGCTASSHAAFPPASCRSRSRHHHHPGNPAAYCRRCSMGSTRRRIARHGGMGGLGDWERDRHLRAAETDKPSQKQAARRADSPLRLERRPYQCTNCCQFVQNSKSENGILVTKKQLPMRIPVGRQTEDNTDGQLRWGAVLRRMPVHRIPVGSG